MNNPRTVFSYRSRFKLLPIIAVLGTASVASADSADVDPPDAAAKAQAFLDEWTAKGEKACEANDPACPKLGESLYNAAQEFQNAKERNKAIAARTILTNPKYHLETTEIGKRALFQLAEDYKAITEYVRAAELYESAAARFPAMAAAPDGLTDALIFRLSSGDFDRALKDAELFDKNYGAKKPDSAIMLWIGISRTMIDAGRFTDAKPILTRIMARVDKDAPVQDRLVAHSALGQTLAKLEDAKGAEHEYEVVRSMWRNAEFNKRLMADGASEPRLLGKALNAVGEALFFFAEQKRKEADAVRFPEYKGPPDNESVFKHINTKVVDWIKKKRPAIEDAEKAYRQIIELQPAPPPRWTIASAARVGTMWGKFVTEFRAAPIPSAWKKNGPVPGAPDLTFEELRKDYYARLDEASDPQKQQAKAAFKTCLDYSAKFQYHDDFSRSCETWLEKHYYKEFIHIDEFIPALRAPSTPLSPMPILTEHRPSR